MTKHTGTRKRGRPPTGWTQIGLKVAPDLLAGLDAWREHNGQPMRPEAIRRLMKVALAAATRPAVHVDGPSFAIGDRVRSKPYGLGKVVSLKSPRSQSGAQGATIAVAWDRREWGITHMVPSALEGITPRHPPNHTTTASKVS